MPRQSDSGVQSGSRKLQKGAPTKTNLPNTSRASKSQNSVSNSFQKHKFPMKKARDGNIKENVDNKVCQNPRENGANVGGARRVKPVEENNFLDISSFSFCSTLTKYLRKHYGISNFNAFVGGIKSILSSYNGKTYFVASFR